MADWRAPRFGAAGAAQIPSWVTDDYSGMTNPNIDPNFNPATSLYPVDTGGGTGGKTATTQAVDPGPSAEQIAARNNVFEAVKGQFAAWGLGSLADLIMQYAQQDYNAESIAFMLRGTTQYKQRFPAMEELGKRGRALSEAEYINYEQNAAALEQRFGLPKGMILGNVTTLLVGDVSAAELQDRATLAAADAISAPKELKDMYKTYYGIDDGGLTAYFLDPKVALPLLEKQSAISRIGTQAVFNKVNTSLEMAQMLQEKGVTEGQAGQGFGIVKAQEGFQFGRGETTTQDQLTKGVFGDQTEAKKTTRIAASRTGRFQGQGGFAADKSGVSGLGSSSS